MENLESSGLLVDFRLFGLEMDRFLGFQRRQRFIWILALSPWLVNFFNFFRYRFYKTTLETAIHWLQCFKRRFLSKQTFLQPLVVDHRSDLFKLLFDLRHLLLKLIYLERLLFYLEFVYTVLDFWWRTLNQSGSQFGRINVWIFRFDVIFWLKIDVLVQEWIEKFGISCRWLALAWLSVLARPNSKLFDQIDLNSRFPKLACETHSVLHFDLLNYLVGVALFILWQRLLNIANQPSVFEIWAHLEHPVKSSRFLFKPYQVGSRPLFSKCLLTSQRRLFPLLHDFFHLLADGLGLSHFLQA